MLCRAATRGRHWSFILLVSTWLFGRYVHAVHHESHNPGPWSGLAFHPVEAAVFFSAYTLVLLWPWPFSWAVW